MIAQTKPKRSSTKERQLAKERQAVRLGDIAVARHDGTLGLDYIKLAQAMILCTLPYSEQVERKATRRARLGDGSHLTVTFHALHEGVPLPYGADRKLWLGCLIVRFGPIHHSSPGTPQMSISARWDFRWADGQTGN